MRYWALTENLIYKVVNFYFGEKQNLFCKFSLDCVDVQVSYIILVCKCRRLPGETVGVGQFPCPDADHDACTG